MRSEYLQRDAKFIIAFPDGRILEGTAYTVDLEMKNDFAEIAADGYKLTSVIANQGIVLHSILAPDVSITYTEEDYKETIERRKREMEETGRVQCEWCGVIMAIKNDYCPACGGWRPLFFELMG